MKRFGWHLQITLIAPFSTSGLESGPSEFDLTLLRNNRQKLILSGPQILGHFRHFVLELLDAHERDNSNGPVSREQAVRWFGRIERQLRQRNDDGEASEPVNVDDNAKAGQAVSGEGAGSLSIRDLVHHNTADEPEAYSRHVTRIRLNEVTRAVDRGAFIIMEQPFPAGTEVHFGTRRSSADHADIVLYGAEDDKNAFEKTFALFAETLTALGAHKGQGFGRLASVPNIDLANAPEPAAEPSASQDTTGASIRATITFAFDRPVVVDPERLSGNLFRSAKIIPGAVLKAAIAQAITRFHKRGDEKNELQEALPEIRLSHAHVDVAGQRSAIPLYATFWHDDEGLDIFDGFKIADDGDEYLFPANFKTRHQEEARKMFSLWPEPEMTLRTRTAISPDTGVASKGQLFSFQAIAPFNVHIHEETTYRFELSWPEALRDKAHELVDLFQSENVHIGKLKSRLVNVKVQYHTYRKRVVPEKRNSPFWRVELITPAHLLGIDQVEALRKGPGAQLGAIYRPIFQDKILNEVEALLDWSDFDCLAAHDLAGGVRSVRYKQMIDGEQRYFPYILTRPGSAWRLKEKEGISPDERQKLIDAFESLARSGLPNAERNLGWRERVYLPENGYGEVLISALPDALR